MAGYLRLEDVTPAGRKTRIVDVRNAAHDYSLGHIRWHGAWRQYVFLPEPDMLFSSGCMEDIVGYVNVLNSGWREEQVLKRQRQLVIAATPGD